MSHAHPNTNILKSKICTFVKCRKSFVGFKVHDSSNKTCSHEWILLEHELGMPSTYIASTFTATQNILDSQLLLQTEVLAVWMTGACYMNWYTVVP